LADVIPTAIQSTEDACKEHERADGIQQALIGQYWRGCSCARLMQDRSAPFELSSFGKEAMLW
jgi:hypothetical protein